jgi:hypothetical protein
VPPPRRMEPFGWRGTDRAPGAPLPPRFDESGALEAASLASLGSHPHYYLPGSRGDREASPVDGSGSVGGGSGLSARTNSVGILNEIARA